MIQSGRLLYSGSVGGRKVHLSSVTRAQVLIIEPTFKDQIKMEKTLKKNDCEPFLCLDIFQALERLHQFSQVNTNGGPAIVFDLVLISEDVESSNFDMLLRKITDLVKSKRTVVGALVSVLGEEGKRNLEAVPWTDYCSFEVEKAVTGPLNRIASVAVQKPLKASSIRKLLSLREVPSEDVNFGLTHNTLMAKIDQVQLSILSNIDLRPIVNPSIGIKLSAEDVTMRGRHLINPSSISSSY